jgi:hypothetical protein
VVVREWRGEVVRQPEGEFRAFVGGNRLNAVSQYYSFVRFEAVVSQQQRLRQRLQAFFDEAVRPAFAGHGSYVVDFWIDLRDFRILVIEINPFHIGAGAALFSWKTDRELFLKGPPSGEGFELRVCEEVEEEPYAILPRQWAEYLAACARQPGCILM